MRIIVSCTSQVRIIWNLSLIIMKYYHVLLASMLILFVSLDARSQSLQSHSGPIECRDILPGERTDFAKLVDVLHPVWTAVSARDEQRLLNYLSSDEVFIRDTAWRGLANMNVKDASRLFDLAMADSLNTRWFTLSNQTMDASLLRRLETMASNASIADVIGIYQVLGQKGDALSHRFLVDASRSDQRSETGYTLALAMSRSIIRHPSETYDDVQLVRRAMLANDAMEQSAWLYVWYRSTQIRPGTAALDLLSQWTEVHFDEAYGLLRQYMIAILGRSAHPGLYQTLMTIEPGSLHPLEAVEIVRILPAYLANDGVQQLMWSMSDFDYARLELLQLIRNMPQKPSDGYRNVIMQRLDEGVGHAYEWLLLVRALGTWWPDDARAVMEQRQREWIDNPHYVNDYIETLKVVYDRYWVIDHLLSLASGDDDAILVPVIQQATGFAMQSPQDGELRALVAPVILRAAHSGSYRVSQALFASEGALEWSKDQNDERLVHHIERGRAISVNVPDLNVPDANVIKRLGPHPIWVLNTEAGDIVMRLDSYRAPSTVSTFAGLVEDGWYVGTPFHRVVHNFVIQSGAIWNPEYTLDSPFRVPTEATEGEFSRGAVGVASAGRDTETSQFFMMHMWHPHLNGGYSNIGRVIEGADVIDSLRQGTLVTGSSIYSCY